MFVKFIDKPQRGEEIFEKYMSDKGLVCKKQKEHLKNQQ